MSADTEPRHTLTADVAELVTRVKTFTITTAEDYHRVALFLLGVKGLRKQIAETFDPHIQRAYTAHRALCAEKQRADAGAIEAERLAKALLVAWDSARQREADAQRDRLQLAEAEQSAATHLAAATAEAAGDYRRADELRAQTVPMAAPLTAPPTPKVSGISMRETWSARVTDLAALVRAAAANPSWVALLTPNMTALNAQARSLRDRMLIPGVEAIRSRDVSASSGGNQEV